eukprot:3270129-Alexandrium_andersonii.AAC.1
MFGSTHTHTKAANCRVFLPNLRPAEPLMPARASRSRPLLPRAAGAPRRLADAPWPPVRVPVHIGHCGQPQKAPWLWWFRLWIILAPHSGHVGAGALTGISGWACVGSTFGGGIGG